MKQNKLQKIISESIRKVLNEENNYDRLQESYENLGDAIDYFLDELEQVFNPKEDWVRTISNQLYMALNNVDNFLKKRLQ